ncbi:uncharacterized protein LOC129593699 [Paramacrobiotus metropolitanus]|uniref:uncharacterized protein LOC129593699 n=1 Tax=Paramacrobiotus metropolitanus TaxID=2943436 RepID=UPI00244573C1|nr:uncharacterized protein LOC129593699 [Paramacrobiotus metropolitanus]
MPLSQSQTRDSANATGETLVGVPGQQLLRITQFDPDSDEWPYWKKRLKNHLFLTKVPDAMQSSFLLDSSFTLLCKMCKPKEPMQMPIKELYEMLDAAYQESTFWIAQRIKFFSAKQKTEETLVQFASELRSKVEHCDFPEDEQEKSLIAVFVMGMKDAVTRKVMSLKDFKTLNEALKEAKENETKRKELGIGIESESDHEVKKVRKWKGKKGVKGKRDQSHDKDECFRCGKSNHTSNECFFKEKECFNCGQRGHTARMCSNIGNKYVTVERDPYDVL